MFACKDCIHLFSKPTWGGGIVRQVTLKVSSSLQERTTQDGLNSIPCGLNVMNFNFLQLSSTISYDWHVTRKAIMKAIGPSSYLSNDDNVYDSGINVEHIVAST